MHSHAGLKIRGRTTDAGVINLVLFRELQINCDIIDRTLPKRNGIYENDTVDLNAYLDSSEYLIPARKL